MLITAPSPARGGFSLTELIVGITLFGVLATTLTTVVINQHRVYVAAADIITARANVRQAADILPVELRGISPARGDIYAMDAVSIEFRAPTGSSVLCDTDSSRTRITLPPRITAARNGTSAWLRAPENGDSLLIYDHGTTSSAIDDGWRTHAIVGWLGTGTCATFTSSPGESATAYSVTLASPLSPTVSPGASIRFFRRSRYELYDASDGQGYLGFTDCLATRTPACSTKQPVSGPYLPLGPASSGMLLSYFDSSGAPTADRLRVARIDVLTRTRTRNDLRIAGRAAGRFTDSLAFSIATRN